MKIKIIVVVFWLGISPFKIFGQSNSEIAGVYIKRAEERFYNLEIDKSLEIFNKALKYMDSVPNARVAKLGTLLFYEHQKYFEARSYARWYFELEQDKSSEDYEIMLDTFVNIQDKIDEYIAEQKALEIRRKQEERNSRRLDSLKVIWENKAQAFEITVDSIYQFNKYKVAPFEKNGKFGILSDVGETIEDYNYGHFMTYDGFILLLDKPKNPTKIYAYNCNTRKGFLIPSFKSFNASSNHYGKVMLPRANGLLISYPDNSDEIFVYNLKSRSFSEQIDYKTFLKDLKKKDIIEKYKDRQVRINKNWFTIGNSVGANIHALYKDNSLCGYFNALNGKIWEGGKRNYLGGFCDGNFELMETDKRFWMDIDGLRQETNKNENGVYKGISRFLRNEKGNYIIKQNLDGKDYLILGESILLNKTHFVFGFK